MPTPMFPVPNDADSRGVSVVQWYAGLAMQAIIAKQATVPDTESERQEIALWSIRMGEAMAHVSEQLKAHQD